MTTRFTDSYLEYAKEFTDCPDVFLMWGALLAISSTLSRSVHVEIGSWNIAPHIWPVLIGKSSSHKSTALAITEDLIESIDPDRLAPHEFSHEAILKSLSEKSARLFIFDEAKSFFDSMGKKYNEGLKALFTTLYRKPNYNRTTITHGQISINGAYLTIGMATTPEWLRESLTNAEDSAMSGFLARFLMVPYTGNGNHPMSMPPPHDRLKFTELVEMLRKFRFISSTFTYSAEARKRLDDWFVDTTERENESLPVLGPFFEHFKNEAIHKLSILLAIDRGEKEITIGSISEAILGLSYIEEMLPTVLEDITDKRWDIERKKIVAFIRKRGSCKREELALAVHIHGDILSRYLSGLEADGRIVTSKVKGTTKSITEIIWVGDR